MNASLGAKLFPSAIVRFFCSTLYVTRWSFFISLSKGLDFSSMNSIFEPGDYCSPKWPSDARTRFVNIFSLSF